MVGDPVDVALETRQLLNSGKVATSLSEVRSVASSTAWDRNNLANYMASANQLAATVTPITIPERWHLYRYTSSAEPGELIMLTFHDWSNPSPVLGRPSYVTSYVELSGADAGRFYYNLRVTSNMQDYGVRDFLREGPPAGRHADRLWQPAGRQREPAGRVHRQLRDRLHRQAIGAERRRCLERGGRVGRGGGAGRAAVQRAVVDRAGQLPGLQRDPGRPVFPAGRLSPVPDGAEPAAKYRQTVDRGIWYDYETTFYSSTDSARYQAFLSVWQHGTNAYNNAARFAGSFIGCCAAWTTSSRRTMPPAGRPCRQARAATC